MDFIDRLTQKLEEKKITQYKLCKDLNIGQSTISSWKKGNSPSADKIIAIVRYLEVSADWLLGITESEKSDLTENEKELLENFKYLPEREQVKLIGKVESLAEEYKNTASSEKLSSSRTG